MASSKYPLGRAVWSLKHQESMMAVGLGTRQAADEEARAEVEVRIIRADGIESQVSASHSSVATERVSGMYRSLTRTLGSQQQVGEDSSTKYKTICIFGEVGIEWEKCTRGNWTDLWKYAEVTSAGNKCVVL